MSRCYILCQPELPFRNKIVGENLTRQSIQQDLLAVLPILLRLTFDDSDGFLGLSISWNLWPFPLSSTGGVRGRVQRLGYWNANSVRSKKLELVQFLSDHGVNICLTYETHMVPGEDFWIKKLGFFPKNDRHTQSGGSMIFVHCDISYYSVPVSNLQQRDATDICVNSGLSITTGIPGRCKHIGMY